MTQTKAWTVESHGEMPRVVTRQIGSLASSFVRIDVAFASLNFADLLMIEGSYQETPDLPFVPGMEVSGRVSAVGGEVGDLKPGDRVCAVVPSGALSTVLDIDAASCRIVPDGLRMDVAAAAQIAYGTSYLALSRRARIQHGETLVVLGASGGVGLTAVEIGAQMGARVVAVARGAKKLEIARAAGAHVLIDAETPDLRDALKENGPVDVVYDAVGGQLGEAALRALGPEGRHLLIGFASGDLPTLKPNHLLVKNVDVLGFYWGGYAKFAPDVLSESASTLMNWLKDGRLNLHISHRIPFERAAEGLDLLKSRAASGKVVIEMPEPD